MNTGICPGVKRNSRLHIVLALMVGIIMLGLFCKIAWNTLIEQAMAEFDQSIILLVRSFTSSYMDFFMVNVTNLGSASFYALLAFVMLIILLRRKRKYEAVTLVLCVAGGAFLNEVLKQLFQRSRPDTLPLIDIGGYSFPSGHAMVSVCCYGLLAFLTIRSLASWRSKVIVFIITSIVVTVVGISRIYVGVHYPTDVLAGFAVGTTWLAFCIALLLWLEHRVVKFSNINLP
ncbi:MAG: phosphatase PAP2 family protein [Veillonellaceae bacterium]|jgi:membrane-associated phospholipid phosphatase|nr:phosphatase PAP2 family protein [Veillonellaceae bacterium]